MNNMIRTIYTQPDPPRHEFEVVAMYDFSPSDTDDLPLTKGEKLIVFDKSFDGWYVARNKQG